VVQVVERLPRVPGFLAATSQAVSQSSSPTDWSTLERHRSPRAPTPWVSVCLHVSTTKRQLQVAVVFCLCRTVTIWYLDTLTESRQHS
jgi:hypothetical protein